MQEARSADYRRKTIMHAVGEHADSMCKEPRLLPPHWGKYFTLLFITIVSVYERYVWNEHKIDKTKVETCFHSLKKNKELKCKCRN